MKKKAFTLIELLVVIAVISIFGAILLPTIAAARRKALSIQQGKPSVPALATPVTVNTNQSSIPALSTNTTRL